RRAVVPGGRRARAGRRARGRAAGRRGDPPARRRAPRLRERALRPRHAGGALAHRSGRFESALPGVRPPRRRKESRPMSYVKGLRCRECGAETPVAPLHVCETGFVSFAISKAIEFGFETVSCASTGNLANSVSAHAARAGLACYIFIPDDLEQGKVIGSAIYDPRTIAVRGNYDDVNRLCSEVADKYGWAFVNINVRPYYTEGAKTYGFEIAEQLGWHLPRHIVV